MKQKYFVKTRDALFVLVPLLVLILFAPAAPVLAQSTQEIENPAKDQLVDVDFKGLLTRIIGWALYAAGGIAVLFLIVGGFQYITSRGNEEQTETAKKTITSAIIGIVIIVMAFAIVSIVNNILTSNA